MVGCQDCEIILRFAGGDFKVDDLLLFLDRCGMSCIHSLSGGLGQTGGTEG